MCVCARWPPPRSLFPNHGDHEGWPAPKPAALAHTAVIVHAKDQVPLPGAAVLQEHGPATHFYQKGACSACRRACPGPLSPPPAVD